MATKSNSFSEAMKALQNTLCAAYELAPAVVITAIILAAMVAYVSLFYIGILQGFIIILIILISILVYYKSSNYGEAALSLMAGLLAAFSVNWTWNRLFVFMVTLVGFLLFIILIGSLKLASKKEDIYLNAAIHIDVNRAKDVAQQLGKISDSTLTKNISTVDKAQAIQIMVFHKIPIESIHQVLKMVEILSVITNLEVKYVTLFLIALSGVLNISPGRGYERNVEELFSFYQNAPVSRKEFIEAFMNTKRLVTFGKVDQIKYRLLLKDALDNGISPEEAFDYIQERIAV